MEKLIKETLGIAAKLAAKADSRNTKLTKRMLIQLVLPLRQMQTYGP